MNFVVVHNGEEIAGASGAERIPEKDERLTYVAATGSRQKFIVEHVETIIVNGEAQTRIHVK